MTITLETDDEIGRQLQRIAAETGKPLEQVVNETLAAGIRAAEPLKEYKVQSVSMGGPMPGVNLDKALQLAADLEDEELIRKLEMGK